ncbi:MAG: hypothetical protein J0L75_14765 [Spirochaetes bacterium]|nr:hypothetical protein [Spirochaetota bacterium]
MARTKSIRLKKSRNELQKLLKLSRRLAKSLAKSLRSLDQDERNAVELSAASQAALAARLKNKTKKSLKLAKAKLLKKLKKAAKKQAALAARKGRRSKTAGKKTLAGKGAARGRRSTWTAAHVALLRKLLVSGKTVAQVAAKLKRQPGAIRQRLVQEGISLRALKKSSDRKLPKTAKTKKAPKRGRPSKPRKIRRSSLKIAAKGPTPPRGDRPAPVAKVDVAKDVFFVSPEKTKKA